MSDYVHRKVVRLPFPKELLQKCEVEDHYYCEAYLKKRLGELWKNGTKNGFDVEHTDKRWYIDWVYYQTYGDESGEYGFARELTLNELNVIKPLFDKLDVDYNDKDLRAVDYCYYNSCEPNDYYDIQNQDDAHLFLK